MGDCRAGAIDQRVIASAAEERVGSTTSQDGIITCRSIESIGSDITGKSVCRSVACAVDGIRAGEPESLHIGGQSVAHGVAHFVDPLAGELHHHIGCRIHDVGVVPRAAHERIAHEEIRAIVEIVIQESPVATIEHIVALAAEERVVAIAASHVVVAAAPFEPIMADACVKILRATGVVGAAV